MQGWESQMKTNAVYLGIDVSKHKLHVASPDRLIGEFANTCSGHRSLIARLQTLGPQLIVLEASGGYERLVCEALQDAALAQRVDAWRDALSASIPEEPSDE